MQKSKYERNIRNWIGYTSTADNLTELRRRVAKKKQMAKEAQAIALEVSETTHRMNTESKKMILQARIKSILNMYHQANKSSDEIAGLLEIETPFVEKVLKQYAQKKNGESA